MFIDSQPQRWRRSDFLIGTVFPDIRYLGVISRERTHISSVQLTDILATESSFAAGMKFHAWLDRQYGQIIGEDSFIKDHPLASLCYLGIKLFEDEQLYANCTDWSETAKCFDQVLTDEVDYGIEESDVERWHSLIKTYLLDGPVANRKKALFELGFNPIQIANILASIIEVKKEQAMLDLIKKFENRVEESING